MKPGKSKAKGSAFERKIAKAIVKAFKKDFGIEQRECWRSVLSGGHVISCGDLEMSKRLEKIFPYSVECKHRKKIRWENFLLSKRSEEMNWITQVKDGTKKRKDLKPLLVMKANNFQIKVLMRTAVIDKGTVLMIEGEAWRMLSWSSFLKRALRKAILTRKKVIYLKKRR